MMDRQVIAMYLRLSGMDKEKGADESNGITNQRQLILDYIRSDKTLSMRMGISKSSGIWMTSCGIYDSWCGMDWGKLDGQGLIAFPNYFLILLDTSRLSSLLF